MVGIREAARLKREQEKLKSAMMSAPIRRVEAAIAPPPIAWPQLLLSVTEVAAILGISRASVWRKAAAGEIPKSIRIGGATRWRTDEILAVIAAASAER